MRDPFGDAPEVFDQHDPEGDGDRPEFADRQRLHFLIGAYEAAQHISVEMAIGVGDKSPGEAEHAGISCERAICQLRQLPIIAWRQSGADFADLPFDQIVIVDQPFGSRGNRAALIDCFGDRAVGVEQNGSIIGEPAARGCPLTGFDVIGWAAARLRACSSSRSALKSSSRTGSPLCHREGDGNDDTPRPRTRSIKYVNASFLWRRMRVLRLALGTRVQCGHPA